MKKSAKPGATRRLIGLNATFPPRGDSLKSQSDFNKELNGPRNSHEAFIIILTIIFIIFLEC